MKIQTENLIIGGGIALLIGLMLFSEKNKKLTAYDLLETEEEKMNYELLKSAYNSSSSVTIIDNGYESQINNFNLYVKSLMKSNPATSLEEFLVGISRGFKIKK